MHEQCSQVGVLGTEAQLHIACYSLRKWLLKDYKLHLENFILKLGERGGWGEGEGRGGEREKGEGVGRRGGGRGGKEGVKREEGGEEKGERMGRMGRRRGED